MGMSILLMLWSDTFLNSLNPPHDPANMTTPRSHPPQGVAEPNAATELISSASKLLVTCRGLLYPAQAEATTDTAYVLLGTANVLLSSFCGEEDGADGRRTETRAPPSTAAPRAQLKRRAEEAAASELVTAARGLIRAASQLDEGAAKKDARVSAAVVLLKTVTSILPDAPKKETSGKQSSSSSRVHDEQPSPKRTKLVHENRPAPRRADFPDSHGEDQQPQQDEKPAQNDAGKNDRRPSLLSSGGAKLKVEAMSESHIKKAEYACIKFTDGRESAIVVARVNRKIASVLRKGAEKLGRDLNALSFKAPDKFTLEYGCLGHEVAATLTVSHLLRDPDELTTFRPDPHLQERLGRELLCVELHVLSAAYSG